MDPTAIPEDKVTLSRRSYDYQVMEGGGEPAAPMTAAQSESYWSQAYQAYSVVRDTVAETYTWSKDGAYGIWAKYMGYGPVKPTTQESNLTLLKDLFGPTLVDPHGRAINTEDALGSGRYIGIYVGAEWASSCVPFVADLQRAYEKVNSQTMLPVLEVVYISADKTQEQFDGYMKTMPWVALPWPKLQMRKKVMTIYKAATLPKFILLSPTGKVMTDDEKWPKVDKKTESFPWSGQSDSCVVQ